MLCVSIALVISQALISVDSIPKIAILRDSFSPAAGHSDPNQLLTVLNQAGYPGECISAEQLGDPSVLNKERYWLVILPYGDCFPAMAHETFLAYLRAGGDFLSTGGYAFDKLLAHYDGRWLTSEELRGEGLLRIDLGRDDKEFLIGDWNFSEPSGSGTKRWTGKDAGVRLPVVPGTAYTLEMSVSAEPRTASLPKRILINGQPAAEIPATGGQVLRLTVHPEQIGAEKNLTIVFDAGLWKPSELMGTSDTRALGVAVEWITLAPEGKEKDLELLSSLTGFMNMRHGIANDFLEWKPEQLGVFDAGHQFSGGQLITAATDQQVVPATFQYKGNVEGWAAAGTTGANWYWTTPADRSRWLPLLETHDELNRFIGYAGALMINHLEPYRGSLWAYFGVTNEDIFSGERGKQLLLSVVAAMKQGNFLHDARPSRACYRQGEAVEIQVNVSNFSSIPLQARIPVEIVSEAGERIYQDTREITLAPDKTEAISFTWAPANFADDLYIAKIDLNDEKGRCLDVQRTAFYVWNTDTLAKGMKLSYAGNYFREDGVPRLLTGSQTFYPVKTVTGNSVLDIERDYSMLADNGIHLSRSFMSVKDERFCDALVMAAQRHRNVLFYEGLSELSADPALVKKDAEHAANIAERYRDIPGILIDLRNEPTFRPLPDATRDVQFNMYLDAKYGGMEALRAAWGGELKPDDIWEKIPMGWYSQENWSSLRSRDVYRFQLEAGRHWVEATTQAMKEKDPNRLISVGYLQSIPDVSMDPLATSDALDFMDRHWYGKMDLLSDQAAQLIMSDRRYCGKAPSAGEFGSKTYPTFAETQHNFDTVDEQETRFLTIGHNSVALGGTFFCNWHWRDPMTSIFPYGMVYSDFTPKPVLKAYRAMSLLFSTMHPVYVPLQAYLVLPDETRFGGASGRIADAIQHAAKGLIEAGLRTGAIGEWDLARLPREARMLILPVPLALSDDGYNHLRAFVAKGGVLYLSGDYSYDTDHKRTKQERLEDLAGIKFTEECYPDIHQEKGNQEQINYIDGPTYKGVPSIKFNPLPETTVIASANDQSVAVHRTLDKGSVIFSSDGAEFTADAPLAQIYTIVARYADMHPEQTMPIDPKLSVFRLPLEKSGEAVMMNNSSKEMIHAEAALDGHTYTLAIAPDRQGVLASCDGKLFAVEAQGEVRRDGQLLIQGEGRFFLVSLDQSDIETSSERVLISFHSGNYILPWKQNVCEAGEVCNGSWRALKQVYFSRNGEVKIPELYSGELFLLTLPSDIEKARADITQMLVN